MATNIGDTSIVCELLKRKANPDIQNINGDTALHIAANNNSWLACSYIIASGATYNIKNNAGVFPLETDQKLKNARMVSYNKGNLMKKVNANWMVGGFPTMDFFITMVKSHPYYTEDLLGLVLMRPEGIKWAETYYDTSRLTPIIASAEYSNFAVMHFMLDMGVSTASKTPDGTMSLLDVVATKSDDEKKRLERQINSGVRRIKKW